MNEQEGERIDRESERPWKRFRRWYRELRRRFMLRPRDLTPADIVPWGAQPICPACILPHHPMARLCPECGEIVSPYATIMPFVWIFVWGPRLQRVVRQGRLSRLLCAGLLVSALGYLAGSLSWWPQALLPPTYAEAEPVWVLQAPILSVSLVLTAVHLGAAFRMLEAAIRAWGTWRQDTAEEPADN